MIKIFSIWLGLMLAWSAGNAAITLTQVPVGMRKQNADIALSWTGGNNRVYIRASTVPGGNGAAITHYDSLHLPSQLPEGSYTFRINPDIPVLYRNTDLRFGVNYCILTDGQQSSSEFIIIIESSVAPSLSSPANAVSIKDLTPTFSWTGDAPYYAVLLSDEPFKISDSGSVTGVSAIWQIITPFTSARYGDADPSGYNTVPAPPLISGKTYNWLVLNNYGNNSASTSKVAPVPFSFVYSPAPPLPSAQLLEPNDKDTIPGSDQIVFRWALVDGAVSYKLELLEENLVDGSQADIAIWKASSTGGQINLDNASGLLRRYNYKWRVYAIGNNGAASISDKRSFFYAASVGDINLTLKNKAGQSVAYAPVKLNRLGGVSSAVFQSGSTDNTGVLTVKNAPLGSYEASVENLDGYLSQTDTIIHNNTQGTSQTMTISPVLGKILGKISDAGSGTGILNAKVTVTGSDGSQWTSSTNSQGNYSIGVPYGNWQVKAEADGYGASDAATASLNSTTNTKTVDIPLAANKFTLSGTVQNSFTRQGIFGATVFLTQGGTSRSVNTDGNGSFSFSVPSGALSIRVSSAGFASPEPASVTIDGDKTLNMLLDPNASILSGRTKDASGTAISGVIVQAVPKAGPSRSIVSDFQGAYELSLPAGDWILSASAKGYSSTTTHKFLLDVSKTVQGVDFDLTANRSFISGRVAVNGSGLAGALVAVTGASALSDNSGYYLLSVNAGNQSVSASKEGYLISKTYTVPVNPGDTVANIDFPAVGNAGVVRGRALAGGAGVVGARVDAVNQANLETFSQLTDGTGAFSLSLPGSDYKISANKEGFVLDQPLALSLPPGGVIQDQILRLLPNQGNVSGTVSSGNVSLGGCEVSYTNQANAALTGKTVTDPQGRYSLSLQAGAAYSLSAACQGYQSLSATTAALSNGGNLVNDFNLAKAGSTYRGKVIDVKGAVVAGAKVSAEKNGEVVTGTSDFAGAYVLSLGSGTYAFSLSKSGYRTVTRNVQLSLGDNTNPTADTLYSSLGRLAGRVLADGAIVPGAFVTLVGLSPDAGGGTFTTDADGRFSSDVIPAGTYSATASADGYTDGKIPSLTVVAGELTNVDVIVTANKGSLSGLVKLDGVAAAGVSVVVNAYGVSRTALSGSDGTYLVDKLAAGVYTISATQAGYSADTVWKGQTLASSGSLANLNFSLSKNAGSLSGTVTGAATSSGIGVSLVGKKGFRAYGTCDGSGKFSFPSLPADVYVLSVAATGYKISGSTQSPEVTVTAATVFNVSLSSAVFRLAGKILNQGNVGIAGLPVELRTSKDLFKTVSGSDGSYAFAEIPAGDEYQLSCKPPTADYDAKDTTFALSLDAPAQVSANLQTLSRQASLSGSILLDGAAVEGALVRLTGSNNKLTALSQPNGTFKVSGVAGSDSVLAMNISKAGANTVDTTLVVGIGEAKAGVTIRLKTLKIKLTATLISSEGKPLAAAKVVVSAGQNLDTLTATQAGLLVINDLPANQAVTLATALSRDGYDNVESSVFLKEADTGVTVTPKVHTTVLTLKIQDQTAASVDGANVILNGKSLGLSAQGKVTALNLARGDYRINAGKASYKSGPEQTLTLPGDTTAQVTLTLTKVQGGLYGSVSDSGLDKSAGGAASSNLIGAEVALTSGTDSLKDTVNSLGQYFVDGLGDGKHYGMTVSLPGYLPINDSVVGNIQAQNRNLILKPFPGAALGRLSSGKAGVAVSLLHSASGRITTIKTSLGGYYAFGGLQNKNDYAVQAVDGSSSTPQIAFQAGASLAKRIDLTLDSWGRITGTIKGGPAGATVPVGGASVSARNTLTGAIAWALSDSAGHYTVNGLASGSFEVTVERKGYRTPKAVTIAVTKGVASAGNDFTLDEVDAGIAGTVTDDNGQGLAATVALAAGKDTLKVEADGGGQFVFGGQAAGTYQLSASKAGYSAPGPLQVTYSGKGLVSQNLVLSRRKNQILGVVRDALTNTPLAGATVKVLSGSVTPATADTAGRYSLALAAGTASPVFLEASNDGYLTRTQIPAYLDADGSAAQDLALTADYKFDGTINVVVKEGKDTIPGLVLVLQPFHPDDSLIPSLTGKAASSFRNLRRPAPYTLKVKRDGFKDINKVVELTAKQAVLDVTLAFPTSQIRLFTSGDGKRGKSVDLSLNGQALSENPDTTGLYISGARLKPDRYEVSIKAKENNLIPMSSYFINLGEDSVRTDTLPQVFFQVPIADSIIGTAFTAKVLRTDSLRPAPAVACSLFYRMQGEPLWKSIALDSVKGGFAGSFPAQDRAGGFEYYQSVKSPSGARIGTVTSNGSLGSTGPVSYSSVQSPGKFTLRDPFLLFSIALLPQRLEADTSLYSLGARDIFQVQMRGENGRDLNPYFDAKAAKGDTGATVAWSFANPTAAAQLGLTLSPDTATPRLCRFHGGTTASDSVFQIICSARMGAVRLKKTFFVKIQDLTPVSIGIKYVKENRVLEEDGASLLLANANTSGYLFSAFAKTAEGRIFNISPRWSFGADSVIGSINQQGAFVPDSSVARSAALTIRDTLAIGVTTAGATLYQAFAFQTNIATFTQVVPSAQGRALVSNGEGTLLNFNLAGLSKAFTVSVKKPKVSGLLRSSPRQEVVGDILDIVLSERQPFKADSGAVLQMPVGKGIAQHRTVYLGHWNSARLTWETVDSAIADTAVKGNVYSFSDYAVLMGSQPLGAYDFMVTPNPFSAEDPWGLQLGYTLSSEVSSQVGVKVEVFNMMGDKVYESEEIQVSKGSVTPGTKKAGLKSSDRLTALGPFVWDGHDQAGVACRNGRYLLKLIVNDGKGKKEYLKKVVMLK